eukprot:2598264-Pyramimonas_sp.AAC.1
MSAPASRRLTKRLEDRVALFQRPLVMHTLRSVPRFASVPRFPAASTLPEAGRDHRLSRALASSEPLA